MLEEICGNDSRWKILERFIYTPEYGYSIPELTEIFKYTYPAIHSKINELTKSGFLESYNIGPTK